MSRPWFETRPNLIERIRAELRVRYPDLQVVEEAGVVFARGSLPIIHQGMELDRYQIEIAFPSDYPKDPTESSRDGRQGAPRPPPDGSVRNFFISQSLVKAGHP
jgi:hypothetical protein